MVRNVVTALAAVMAVSATTTFAANPFVDVPIDSWAYQSVEELADAGVIQGVDGTYFQGDRPITRYEAAEMTAKAMAHMDKASVEQRTLINKLADEYADELKGLGVRVDTLENKVGNIRVYGDAFVRFRYQQAPDQHKNWGKENDNSWDTRFRIRAQGQVNDRTKVSFGLSTGFKPFGSDTAASEDTDNPFFDLGKIDYNFGGNTWELSVGRNDVYRIGRDAYGFQYFDGLDGIELRYHTDKVAATAGYGKFTAKKKPTTDWMKGPKGNAYYDYLDEGVKTGYGEVDVFFGGGKWARSEAGVYYNHFELSEGNRYRNFYVDDLTGYFTTLRHGKWSLLANYERVSFNDGYENAEGNDYGDVWIGKLQYGNALFQAPGTWDAWVEYLDIDDGAFIGGNPFTWRYSYDMDNQRTWGAGIDYIVAKNVKLSVMQSFATRAKVGSDDPNEMTRVHFQILF